MENKNNLELETLHNLSLDLAQTFNTLYWDQSVETQEVLDALERYADVRRALKERNQGEPYKAWEADAIMKARPSIN